MQYPSPGPGLDDAGRVDQPRYCAALISCKTDDSPASCCRVSSKNMEAEPDTAAQAILYLLPLIIA